MWVFVHARAGMCVHACAQTDIQPKVQGGTWCLFQKHTQMKSQKSPLVLMCLDKFIWQVAELATMSETNHNSVCQFLHSKTNKRFRDWDGKGEGKKEEREIKTIKTGAKEKDKKKKNRKRRERIYSIHHPYCENWHTALQEVYSTGHKRPCRVQKKKKKMAGGTAWQISHPWTTGMKPEWRKDLRGGRQTAWHINHPSPMGHKIYRKTQVAERHGLAGSVHMEVARNCLTHLSDGECKAKHLT